MERAEASEALRKLVGRDLRDVANELEIRIRTPNGKINKGWAGQAIERFLGLPINSAQSPNFGSWELKTTSIKKGTAGWQYKETMKITMIDAYNVRETQFVDSHMYAKLNKFLLVIRTAQPIDKDDSTPSYVVKTSEVNLGPEELAIVESDYNLVRDCLLDPNRGFEELTGSMGTYIQPRTNGPGHGSVSRAFYARKLFLNTVAPLNDIIVPSHY